VPGGSGDGGAVRQAEIPVTTSSVTTTTTTTTTDTDTDTDTIYQIYNYYCLKKNKIIPQTCRMNYSVNIVFLQQA